MSFAATLGLVALVQVIMLMLRNEDGTSAVGAAKTTADVRRSMSLGGIAFVLIAALIALLGHSLVDFNFHIPANTMVAAFVFGILARPTRSGGAGSEDSGVSELFGS